MNQLRALRAKKAELVAKAEAINAKANGEDRELTAEETAEFNALMTQVRGTKGADGTFSGGLNERIARQEELDEEARGFDPDTEASAPAKPGTSRPAPKITSIIRDLGADKPWGHDSGAGFGEFLLAIRSQRLGGPADPRLQAAAQGAGEAMGEDGGFLVMQDVMVDLSKAINSGAVLSRVQRIPLKSGSNGVTIRTIKETSRATGYRWGAVQGYWVDEGEAPTPSRPKFAPVNMKLNKLAALGYGSDELLEDAEAFQGVMMTAFQDELQFLGEDAIFNGSGAGQPLGFMRAPAKIAVAKETNQPAATINTRNLSNMWARFMGKNPVWFINRDVNPQLDELSIPAGTGALEPRFVTYGSDGALRIKGAPVVEVEYCATLGTEGDIVLADLSAYGYIDGGGIKTASSMHVAFLTDEMAFRATMRIDGQVLPQAAITPFKGTNTRSPIVTLATRS